MAQCLNTILTIHHQEQVSKIFYSFSWSAILSHSLNYLVFSDTKHREVSQTHSHVFSSYRMWRAHPDIPLHRASEVFQTCSRVFSSYRMWRAHPDIPLHRASEVFQTCSRVFSSYRMWRAHPDILLHRASEVSQTHSHVFSSYHMWRAHLDIPLYIASQPAYVTIIQDITVPALYITVILKMWQLISYKLANRRPTQISLTITQVIIWTCMYHNSCSICLRISGVYTLCTHKIITYRIKKQQLRLASQHVHT